MKFPKTKRLTMEQEKQIRRAFFYDNMDPDAICEKWGISKRVLRVIVGGPLIKKAYGIEQFMK